MEHVGDLSDQERFERLFTDHFEATLAYAMARTDPETAQDAVADTFLVAWRRLDQVPEPPRAWLLGVTRRTLSTQRRSRARQDSLRQKLRIWRPEGPLTAEQAAPIDSEIAQLALNRLAEGDRELLCLLAWDDLTLREAAEVLGCTVGAFRVRYLRARRRYRVVIDVERAATAVDERASLPGSEEQENTA